MPSFSSNPLGRQGLDAQAAFFTEVARRSLDATGQLGQFNLHLSRQLLNELAAASRQALASSSPLQAMAIALSASQAALEHIRHYQQQVAAMFTGTQLQAPARSQHLQGGAAWQTDSRFRGDELSDAASAGGYTRTH